jgi:hypothetical protein
MQPGGFVEMDMEMSSLVGQDEAEEMVNVSS